MILQFRSSHFVSARKLRCFRSPVVTLLSAFLESVREQAGIRAGREHRAAVRTATHKLRKSGTGRRDQPIQDVACARLRSSVAEVECMPGPRQERIEKCPFS